MRGKQYINIKIEFINKKKYKNTEQNLEMKWTSGETSVEDGWHDLLCEPPH
jgi:hypothetical protein